MWTAVMTDAVRSCIQATRRRQWAIKQRNPRRYCSGRAGNPKAVIQSLQCDLLVCQLSAPPARLIRHPSLTFVIVHRSLPPPCRAATAQMSKKTIKPGLPNSVHVTILSHPDATMSLTPKGLRSRSRGWKNVWVLSLSTSLIDSRSRLCCCSWIPKRIVVDEYVSKEGERVQVLQGTKIHRQF